MRNTEIEKYKTLNELAEQNGTVIFGGQKDREIPLCELKQAFVLNTNLYNRSIVNLSISDAAEVYDACVAPLKPKIVLLHIGVSDLDYLAENAAAFEQQYREFITRIRAQNKECRVWIICLDNPTDSPSIAAMNKQLRFIAESSYCEFGDISNGSLWTDKKTKGMESVFHSVGFFRRFSRKCSMYDLINILICYEFFLDPINLKDD